MLPVFLPITVAVVAGDTIAGEAATGTLRYLLVRPVGRLRLLSAKLVSVAVFVLLAVLFVTVTAYVVGVAAFGFGPDASLGGTGGITSLSGVVLTPTQLAERTALTIAYLALCMLALGAVGLFFSTLTDSPLAAALGVLAFVVASTVLLPLDAASAIRFYLPTRHWLAWVDLYREPILWRAVRQGADGAGRVRARRVRGGVGELRDEGRHELTGQPRPVSGAADRPRSTSATTAGSPGSCPCDTGAPATDVLQGDVDGAVEPGGVGRGDRLVGRGPDRQPRQRRPTPAAASSRDLGAARGELVAGHRAGVGDERDGAARQRRAAQRRAQRDDPARLGRPVVAGDPQPGHHPARRVADDVDARRARGERAVDGPVQRVDLRGQVAGPVPRQRDHGGGAAGRADAVGQRLQRGLRAAVARARAAPGRARPGRGGRRRRCPAPAGGHDAHDATTRPGARPRPRGPPAADGAGS